MRKPTAAALHEVLREYLAFYRKNWSEGKLLICNEAAVKERARRCLASPDPCAPSEVYGAFDVYNIAEKCLKARREQGRAVLRKLSKALEFLELICVNLFLSPWRREIRSLKTFTGNFVYHVQSVLPEGVVQKLLEEIGYVATTTTEFSLVRKLNEEEAEQAAFELFLARIECEDILEITKCVRESDLEDILQKRAQKHWHPQSNQERTHLSSQEKEYTMTKGTSDTQGCQSPQQAAITDSKLSLEDMANSQIGSELGLQLAADEPHSAPKFTSEQTVSESHVDTSTNSCVKSSDSEDFLTKYSDIVIGQKPLHLPNLSPKAPEDKTWATGLLGTMLGTPANAAQLFALLSPDASGPQALAILNDATLESRGTYGCRTEASSKDPTELKISDAMNCLSVHESDATDQPKELKGNSIQSGNKPVSVCSLSKEETTYHLPSTSNKLKIKDGSVGVLMYPVEETAQPETCKRNNKEYNYSRMKLADLPGGYREGLSDNLYSSNLFCNTIGSEFPTVDSDYNRLLVGIPGTYGAGGCFRDAGESSGPTCVIPPDVRYEGNTLANVPCRREPEGCPLYSSFTDKVSFDTCTVKVNETNPEGYVIISKDE